MEGRKTHQLPRCNIQYESVFDEFPIAALVFAVPAFSFAPHGQRLLVYGDRVNNYAVILYAFLNHPPANSCFQDFFSFPLSRNPLPEIAMVKTILTYKLF